MLNRRCPEAECQEAYRAKIMAGDLDCVLEQLETQTPKGYEVVVMNERPLPDCYVWWFNAHQPTGQEIFLVYRPMSEREMAIRQQMIKMEAKKRLASCP